MRTSAIILVAGLSSRMGEFKPLMKLKDKTVIENLIDSILSSDINEIVIVLGYRGNDIENHLIKNNYKEKIKFVYNEDYYKTDMLKSIKIGISNLSSCDAFFIIPGDMPAISKNTFISLREEIKKRKAEVVFVTIDGYKKHPPIIDYNFKDTILNYNGDGGLREIWRLKNIKIEYIPVNDHGCEIDIDTQSDYKMLVNYMKNREE